MATSTLAEWTVMIYMNAEPPGFDKSLEESINEFRFSGSNEKMNIMICVDRNVQLGQDPNISTFPFPSIYRVTKNEIININTPPLHFIKNERMGNFKVLQEFLQYCKDKFSAKKYMLSFWDHGTGTAIEAGTAEMTVAFENLVTSTKSNDLTQLWESISLYNNKFFQHASTDRNISTLFNFKTAKKHSDNANKLESPVEKKEDFLFVSEIRFAIKNVFKDLIDIISFDACWLQMFENAYTLKDCGKLMIASENLIAVEGMGYKYFFHYLSKRPQLEAQEAAALLINSSFLKVHEENKFTLSSINLNKVQILADKINTLAEILKNNICLLFINIRNARFLCLSYYDEEDPSEFDLKVIDLIYFLKKLASILTPLLINNKRNDEKKLYISIINIIDEITIVSALELISYKQIGCAISEEKENDKRWGAHGFSIFFPEHFFEWESYKDLDGFYFGTNALTFSEENSWSQFLNTYFEYLRNPASEEECNSKAIMLPEDLI